jgi:broad specificity phosphatase PhoE
MTPHSELWLFRHGETEWSLSGAHTSRTDLPLTEEGERRAKFLPQFVEGKNFALVLSSPLTRALRTCRMSGLGNRCQVTQNLCEWDYGDYEGKTTVEIRKTDPTWSIWDGYTPGGETGEQVAARADRVIEMVRNAGGNVAVFSHGHMLRVLTARWLGLSPAEGRLFALSTGTLSVLAYERDTPVIKVWNQAPLIPTGKAEAAG